MKKLLLTLIATFFVVAPLHAECTYNGQLVPTGTEIGGLVCQADGSWQ